MADVSRRWAGQTVVCIASGPSLTQEDCAACEGLPTIVINTSYLLALWAPVLYACDPWWWQQNIKDVRESFTGECWTQDKTSADRYKLNYIESERKEGLSRSKVIYQGSNSGYQAINLAYLFGASKIILLGYDMMAESNRHHWHKEHRNGVVNPYSTWLRNFEKLAWDLETENVRVVNCTRRSALKSFPCGKLEHEIKGALLTA